MRVTRLILPLPLRQQIAEAAEAAWPQECCGLLVGSVAEGEAVVGAVVPSANLWQPGDTAAAEAWPGYEPGFEPGFEIDPAVLIATERSLRGTSERIIGPYHSHPNHPAEPSPRDAAGALYPEHLWLIVSVYDGVSGAMQAWRLAPAASARAGGGEPVLTFIPVIILDRLSPIP